MFYGPLLALCAATKSAYDAMVRQHSSDGSLATFIRGIKEDPSGAEGVAYRHWIRCVLQPLNEKAADVIVNHLNLLESRVIHPSLLQLVAHVNAYRVLLRRWEEGLVDYQSYLPYPDDLERWVSEAFDKLKARQADLIGIYADGGQGSPLMRLLTSKL